MTTTYIATAFNPLKGYVDVACGYHEQTSRYEWRSGKLYQVNAPEEVYELVDYNPDFQAYVETFVQSHVEVAIERYYGNNAQLLADDIVTADTLVSDLDDAFAVRYFSDRVGVPFPQLLEWCEYDGCYCIAMVVSLVSNDTAKAVRELLPPSLECYVVTDEEDETIRDMLEA